MPFSGYRDIIQRRDNRLNTRQERRRQWRAVIVDSQGNQSGAGDIWADENARRLWVMPIGGGQPYQVLCVRIGRPVIGLGVIVGYAEGSNTQEVLRDDYEFLGPSNVGISWMSPSDTDFQPGGRMQLWIQTKMIQPLATYPISGLTVGVVGGDYPYGGTRKTYAGTTSQDLTASQPAAGQHLFVGLYLDSANTLQTVDGTAVAVASTPPEPTWPDGAFRLSVVRIANPQTSITFLSETNPLNDIFDRRMTWSDENSGLSGLVWLIHDQVITIYTTITAAVTASVSGDTIVIPGGTYTETVTVNKSIALVGFEPGNTIITSSTNDTTTVTISAANVVLRYLKITNTGAGTANTAVGIVAGATNALIDDCTIEKTAGAAATSNALKVEAGTTHQIKDCRITAAVGATGYAIHCDTAASTINVQNGRINDTLADIRTNHASALVILFDPILVNNTVTTTAGTVAGWYTGTTGALLVRPTSGYPGEVWRFATNGFRVKETNIVTAISNAGPGDTIHLYPGTYTVSANIDVNDAITIVGEDPATTIIKTTTNSLTLVTLSAAGASLRNLTIQNTGAGSGGAGVFWTASGCVLDNCIVEVTGAGTTNYGIGPSGAVTGTVKNCTVTVSGATNNYGFAAVVGNSTTEATGCKFSGSTFDIYGTVAGATLTTYNTILANGKVSFAGTYPRQSVQPTPTEPILMNGHPLVWQRGTSFAAAADGTYFADRFGYFKNGTMVHTLSRDTSVPTIAQIGSLFSYSMLVDCTTADGTIAAGDYTFIRQTIEGYDWLQLAQQQWTIPFWVSATKTGIYCFSVVNSGSDRSYVAEYTVAAADTWEYKQVTVPASPSAGTWDYTTGVGARLNWALAAGSTYQTTAGAWQTGGFLGTSSQVNACDDAANNFRLIVGDPVIGPYARPIIPNPFGSYEALLARCQRYAYVMDASLNNVSEMIGAKFSTTIVSLNRFPPVVMRTTPVLTHNITGYTAGAPGTTTVALIDFGAGAFATITGALTVSANCSPDALNVALTAATSWSGTAGNVFALRVGPSVVMVFAPSDYS